MLNAAKIKGAKGMILLPDFPRNKSVIEKNAEYKKAIIMIRKPFKLPRDMEHSINKALSP